MPREDRHGRHRRRVGHRRLLHEIPKNERAQRDHRDTQGRPPRRRIETREAIAEEQADQAPEQPRRRRPPAVRYDVPSMATAYPRAASVRAITIADREKRGPRQSRPDGPGRLRVARGRGREQVRSCRRSRAGDSRWPGCRRRRTTAIAGARNSRSRRSAAARRVAVARPSRRRMPAAAPRRPPDPHVHAPVASQGPQCGGRGGHRHHQHARRLESDAERGQPRRPRHGSPRQVDAAQGGQRQRAPNREAADCHRSALSAPFADGRRSSRTKNGPVRTRPKIHTSSVISAVTP